MKTESEEKTNERKEVMNKVMKEHSDHIKKLVKEGDWEALVQLLNEESKKSGKTDIDWSEVIDNSKDSKDDSSSIWKMVFKSWFIGSQGTRTGI